MFSSYGPELDAELAYRRESLLHQSSHQAAELDGTQRGGGNHWIRAMVMAATLGRH